MRLKKFLLRYYPPGIILEYETKGQVKRKSIDLLDLTASADVDSLVYAIADREPLATPARYKQIGHLIKILQSRLIQDGNRKFNLAKVLRAHSLPLTNIALNKAGSCFITGSYDRSCKIWDARTGEEMHNLEGHRNVVYTVAFNNPYGDKVATGSFDGTSKLWSAETGQLYTTYEGHSGEVVCVEFDPQSTLLATSSMDQTAKIFDVETSEEVCTLEVGDVYMEEIPLRQFHCSNFGFRIGPAQILRVTLIVRNTENAERVHKLPARKEET